MVVEDALDNGGVDALGGLCEVGEVNEEDILAGHVSNDLGCGQPKLFKDELGFRSGVTLSSSNGFDTALYLTSLVSAVPYTVSYVISNTVFLFIFAKPFGEKFTRVKLKYGV